MAIINYFKWEFRVVSSIDAFIQEIVLRVKRWVQVLGMSWYCLRSIAVRLITMFACPLKMTSVAPKLFGLLTSFDEVER